MKKVAIFGVIANAPQRTKYHGTGWTLVLKSILSEKFDQVDIVNHTGDLSQYDYVCLNEGMNYRKDKWNIMGGIQDHHITKLNMINNYEGVIISFGEELDYTTLSNKLNLKTDKPVDINIIYLDTDTVSDTLVLGDSHSLSVYRPGASISRNDGKTLHGFLKEGIASYIKKDLKELTFYAGNIDVRHHLARRPTMFFDIDDMIEDLGKQLKALNIPKINLVELLPIENEDRKIPGTGRYKGTNFFGSKEERTKLVYYINDKLKELADTNGYNLLQWNFNPEEYETFKYMEAGSSVHLSPENYMFYEEL